MHHCMHFTHQTTHDSLQKLEGYYCYFINSTVLVESTYCTQHCNAAVVYLYSLWYMYMLGGGLCTAQLTVVALCKGQFLIVLISACYC